MYRFRPIKFFLISGLLFAGVFTFVLPANVDAQDEELFNTVSIERSVTSRFKLSKSDQILIHAAIQRENRILVLSYLRFSEGNMDFLCLWNKVRNERHEAEANPELALLSLKQRSALGKAREELERRILEMWLDDYISGLTELLELDRVQADCISKVFQRESEKRRKLLATESHDGVVLNTAWDTITTERNLFLKAILDPLQLHDYNLLFAENVLIA